MLSAHVAIATLLMRDCPRFGVKICIGDKTIRLGAQGRPAYRDIEELVRSN